MGNKREIVNIFWKYLKILSLKLGPNSTKFDTKHPWVDGIQNFTNQGPHPSSRGDNSKIIKIHGKYLKIFYARTTRPVSTKLLG